MNVRLREMVRPLFAGAWVLIVRRARRDLALLVTTASLVAIATLVAIGGPHLVLRALDSSVAETVANAGIRSDLTARAPIGNVGGYLPSTDAAIQLTADLPSRLPPGLAAVSNGAALSVVSEAVPVRVRGGESVTNERLRLGMLTDENSASVLVVGGRLPAATTTGDVEVAVSRDVAKALDLSVGTTMDIALGRLTEGTNKEELTRLVVVGIVETDEPSTWVDVPEIWSPYVRQGTTTAAPITRFTVLTDSSGIGVVGSRTSDLVTAIIRVHLVPERFTNQLATQVPEEASALTTNSRNLVGESPVVLGVRSDIGAVLAPYPFQAKAALAQMSVMLAGVIGIAAAVLVLLSRLLVMHRAPALSVERARGASVGATGVRALAESAAVTAVGVTVGAIVSAVLLRSVETDILPIAVVATVGILATPIQAMSFVRGLWRGKRDPANRRDRQAIVRRGKARTLTAELLVVALAILALVALRGRGVGLTRSDGIDPLLALAPLLLAAAVTLMIVRVFPAPIRLIAALARPSRGVLGLLGAVRAQQAIAALPVFALMLGASLAVTGGLLVETFRSGLDDASWQRVGADARIDITPDEAPLEELRSTSGVDAASAYVSRTGVGLDYGATSSSVTIVAVDTSYAAVVDDLPGLSGDSLRALATPVGADEPLPMIVDDAISTKVVTPDINMYYGPSYVPLRVIGTTDLGPTGYLEGPFAYVDLAGLTERMPEAFTTGSVLVVGPGTEAALAKVALPDGVALTRAGWIDDRQSLALVSGVQDTMIWAVIAAAILSIVALVATVIRGSRERGRSLSLLRTLGMPSGLGWWLALCELAPIVIAAVLGGALAGVIVVVALAPTLGIEVLAGGLEIPAPAIDPTVLVTLPIAGLILLILGAIADVIVHRKDRLADVLRVGETS
jgi:putative ABC transport system permease protein